MNVDVLYYFQIEKDSDNKYFLAKDSKDDGKSMSINMSQCVAIEHKDMLNSKEQGFSFKINMADRIYHL